jgi:hypothetical protein
MKNKKIILVVMISLLAVHFLIYGCGTRTKTKTETQTEISAKETAKAQDSTFQSETFIESTFEQKQRELQKEFKESNNSEDIETTTTEVVEIESKEPIYMELENGRFLNINNGKITKTKTTTTGKRKTNQTISANERIAEKSQSKIDSSNQIIIAKKAGIETAKEYIYTQKTDTKEKVSKGWQLGFWGWFWIVALLLTVGVLVYSYYKYGNLLSWFFLIFKRKKQN